MIGESTFTEMSSTALDRVLEVINVCLRLYKLNEIRDKRIFGLSSTTQSSCFNVWEDVSDDFAKICCT